MSVLLSPSGPPRESVAELAPRRFTNLDGLRLGLLGNSKLNADNVLNAVGDLLKERYNIVTTVHATKPSFSHPAPDDTVEDMVKNCDIVIAGVGD